MSQPFVYSHGGFRVCRAVAADGTPDLCAKVEFFPAKGSDELFEALKNAYPETKTHKERKMRAVIEFHLQEQQALGASANCSPATQSMDYSSPESSFACNSNGSAVSPLTQFDSASATPSTPAMASFGSFSQENPTMRQMTSVWSASEGSMPKIHTRRTMTQQEKQEYRVRRQMKACDKCRQRKRKCRHDGAEAVAADSRSRSSGSAKKAKKSGLDPPSTADAAAYSQTDLDFGLFSSFETAQFPSQEEIDELMKDAPSVENLFGISPESESFDLDSMPAMPELPSFQGVELPEFDFSLAEYMGPAPFHDDFMGQDVVTHHTTNFLHAGAAPSSHFPSATTTSTDQTNLHPQGPTVPATDQGIDRPSQSARSHTDTSTLQPNNSVAQNYTFALEDFVHLDEDRDRPPTLARTARLRGQNVSTYGYGHLDSPTSSSSPDTMASDSDGSERVSSSATSLSSRASALGAGESPGNSSATGAPASPSVETLARLRRNPGAGVPPLSSDASLLQDGLREQPSTVDRFVYDGTGRTMVQNSSRQRSMVPADLHDSLDSAFDPSAPAGPRHAHTRVSRADPTSMPSNDATSPVAANVRNAATVDTRGAETGPSFNADIGRPPAPHGAGLGDIANAPRLPGYDLLQVLQGEGQRKTATMQARDERTRRLEAVVARSFAGRGHQTGQSADYRAKLAGSVAKAKSSSFLSSWPRAANTSMDADAAPEVWLLQLNRLLATFTFVYPRLLSLAALGSSTGVSYFLGTGMLSTFASHFEAVFRINESVQRLLTTRRDSIATPASLIHILYLWIDYVERANWVLLSTLARIQLQDHQRHPGAGAYYNAAAHLGGAATTHPRAGQSQGQAVSSAPQPQHTKHAHERLGQAQDVQWSLACEYLSLSTASATSSRLQLLALSAGSPKVVSMSRRRTVRSLSRYWSLVSPTGGFQSGVPALPASSSRPVTAAPAPPRLPTKATKPEAQFDFLHSAASGRMYGTALVAMLLCLSIAAASAAMSSRASLSAVATLMSLVIGSDDGVGRWVTAAVYAGVVPVGGKIAHGQRGVMIS